MRCPGMYMVVVYYVFELSIIFPSSRKYFRALSLRSIDPFECDDKAKTCLQSMLTAIRIEKTIRYVSFTTLSVRCTLISDKINICKKYVFLFTLLTRYMFSLWAMCSLFSIERMLILQAVERISSSKNLKRKY